MKITEAIILCGGLGTRIAPMLQGVPKVLAPVAGHPFIFFVIDHLRKQGIKKIILATGHGHELVEQYITSTFPQTANAAEELLFDFSQEQSPVGTGGALRLALKKTTNENVLAVNGDSLFRIELPALAAAHQRSGALCTIALKPMENFERYGTVILGMGGIVLSFNEKQFCTRGLINGGNYIINKNIFSSCALPSVFSFERNYLEANCSAGGIRGLVQDKYFIDIGVPEDLAKARLELG